MIKKNMSHDQIARNNTHPNLTQKYYQQILQQLPRNLAKSLESLNNLKIAIVQELLLGPGGAENVVLELLKLFPNADLFTVLYNKDKFKGKGEKWKLITNREIKTSKYNFLASNLWQKLPGILSSYRNYFFLWPKAIEDFDFSGYDLVISSHYIGAHGIITQEDTLHISYTHTPARYFYSHYHEYMNSPFMNKGIKKLKKLIFPGVAHKFRQWDAIASLRPDYYIANSTCVKNRINKYYNRDATVIYPPTDTRSLKITKPVKKQDFYITLARLVPQKKIDVIVKAFIKLNRPLIVMGGGVELPKLKQLAQGYSNIEIKGFVSDKEKVYYYQHAKAFVFASYEDFGIVPIEALSAGTPVIAYNKGGTQDYIIPGRTGIFFNEQTPESIVRAVNHFEQNGVEFNQMQLSNFAEQFSTQRFYESIVRFLHDKWQGWHKKEPNSGSLDNITSDII